MRASRRPGGKSSGRYWEDRAAEFLSEAGVRIITRGYRCRLGELDIVAADGDSLVIVEVRARRRTQRGRALETVGHRKQQRIVQAARHFLMRHPAWHRRPVRFDVVAIDDIEAATPTWQWLKNAFPAT